MIKKKFKTLFMARPGLCPNKVGSYLLKETIGYGATCFVVRAIKINTDQSYACKVYSKKYFQLPQEMRQFRDEIRNMAALAHPYIVSLEDFLEDSINYYLFEEFCSGGDLGAFLLKKGRLPESQLSIFFCQLLTAMNFIHQNHIVHRDIKPENVLLDGTMNCKLADFGFSSKVQEGQMRNTICGTLYYAAPEVLKGGSYDAFQADSWSCGVMLYVMVTGEIPWKAKNRTSLLKEMMEKPINVPSYVSPDCAELIECLCEIDAVKRLTIQEALESPFLCKELVAPIAQKKLNLLETRDSKSVLSMLDKKGLAPLVESSSVQALDKIYEETNRVRPKVKQHSISRKPTLVIPSFTKIRIRSCSTIQDGPLFMPGWASK